MDVNTHHPLTPDDARLVAADLRRNVEQLLASGNYDLLAGALGPSLLEKVNMAAARARLSRLIVTADYRILLADYKREIDLSPVHKAVYLLFLNHPEGIIFKKLADYRSELFHLYKEMTTQMDLARVEESVARLVNPLDNAINEKCSRIKKAFADILDPYTASYYFISNRVPHAVDGSGRVWYQRARAILLPREYVVREDACRPLDGSLPGTEHKVGGDDCQDKHRGEE